MGGPEAANQQRLLSSGQRRLWALAQMGGASAAYNELVALRPRGLLDRAALTAALDALVARARGVTVLGWSAWTGEVLQRIGPPDGGLRGLRRWAAAVDDQRRERGADRNSGRRILAGAGRRDSICGTLNECAQQSLTLFLRMELARRPASASASGPSVGDRRRSATLCSAG